MTYLPNDLQRMEKHKPKSDDAHGPKGLNQNKRIHTTIVIRAKYCENKMF